MVLTKNMAMEKITNRGLHKAFMEVFIAAALLVWTSTFAKGCTISGGDRDILCDRLDKEPYCRLAPGKGGFNRDNLELMRSCKPCPNDKFCQDRMPHSIDARIRDGDRDDVKCHTATTYNGMQEGRCAMPVRDIKNIRCKATYYDGSGGNNNVGPMLIITWNEGGKNEVHMHMQKGNTVRRKTTYTGLTARPDYIDGVRQPFAKHSTGNFETYKYLYEACKEQAVAGGRFTWTFGKERDDFLPRDTRQPVVTTRVNRILRYIFF